MASSKHPSSFLLLLLLLLLIVSSLVASSFAQRSALANAEANQYQVLEIKKTRPYVLNQDYQLQIKNRRRRVGKKNKKKKGDNFWGSRPFSAMLPKGFIPPSGSSSCHNAFPNSINFYCGESAKDP